MAPQRYDAGPIQDFPQGCLKEISTTFGKFLISNPNGTLYATSHLCSHYKAPLSKGVLAEDGRLTCPWHGACFNVQTGDIEDAPGLNGLASYTTEIENGRLVIVADPNDKTDHPRPPFCRQTTTNPHTVIILGGGGSSLACIEQLRTSHYTGHIILISSEPYLPIDRPKLSKAMNLSASAIALRSEEEMKKLDVEAFYSMRCVGVDKVGKKVTLEDGRVLRFDDLVIATGGTPFKPPIQGLNATNVHTLRTVHDANTILESSTGKNVVVMGSSFIGMEVASVLASRARSISVIGMETVPFERVLGVQIGQTMMKLHESKGVTFHMSNGVEKVVVDAVTNRATKVVLRNGAEVEVDVLVVGTGVRPATEFLKSTFELERDGSIKVDHKMAVLGENSIYAIGDVARIPYDDGTARIEHWNVAQNQGRIAAKSIAGKPPGDLPTPYFWTVQFGKSLRYCGHSENFDDVLVTGDLDALAFAAYFTENEKIKAVATLGKDPIASHCAELFRLGKMPNASYIKQGKNPLDIPLSANARGSSCMSGKSHGLSRNFAKVTGASSLQISAGLILAAAVIGYGAYRCTKRQ